MRKRVVPTIGQKRDEAGVIANFAHQIVRLVLFNVQTYLSQRACFIDHTSELKIAEVLPRFRGVDHLIEGKVAQQLELVLGVEVVATAEITAAREIMAA